MRARPRSASAASSTPAINIGLRAQLSHVKTLASSISHGSLRDPAGSGAPQHDLVREGLLLGHDSKLVVRKTISERERELREVLTARCRQYDRQRLTLKKREGQLAEMMAEEAAGRQIESTAQAAATSDAEASAAQRRVEVAAEVERAEEAMGEATGYSKTLAMMTERLVRDINERRKQSQDLERTLKDLAREADVASSHMRTLQGAEREARDHCERILMGLQRRHALRKFSSSNVAATECLHCVRSETSTHAHEIYDFSLDALGG